MKKTFLETIFKEPKTVIPRIIGIFKAKQLKNKTDEEVLEYVLEKCKKKNLVEFSYNKNTKEAANNILKSYKNIKKHLNNSELSFNKKKQQYTLDKQAGLTLHTILEITKPKIIVEIGTGEGYSTIIFAHYAKQHNAKVYSIEISRKHAQLAKENLEKYNLNKHVEILRQDVQEALPTLLQKLKKEKQTINFVLLDGPKRTYSREFKTLEPYLQGIAFADNIFLPFFPGMQNYLQAIKKYSNVNLCIGKGVNVMKKN